MAREKVSEFERMLLRSADQAVAIARGEIKPAREYVLDTRDVAVAPPPPFDAERVQRVRDELKLSQPVFAEVLNVSVSLVRAWERGARKPEGAAQRLLQLLEKQSRRALRILSPIGSDDVKFMRAALNHAKRALPAAAKRKRSYR